MDKLNNGQYLTDYVFASLVDGNEYEIAIQILWQDGEDGISYDKYYVEYVHCLESHLDVEPTQWHSFTRVILREIAQCDELWED